MSLGFVILVKPENQILGSPFLVIGLYKEALDFCIEKPL